MKFLGVMSLALMMIGLGPVRGESGQAAQPGRQKVDVSKLGPQVGERVPDFTLKDQTGRDHNLQSIMGPRGAMIVFFRSADW
jgi:hypothetical protein